MQNTQPNQPIKPWRHRKGAEQPPPAPNGPMAKVFDWLADKKVHNLTELAPLSNSMRCTISNLALRGRIISLGEGDYRLPRKREQK